ncbi:MAG: hypothetical protein JRF30_11365 [Deltaproteobacteria bacterium]|nr:hypothetical protein [Deltaproteobacteria bacterium]
MEIIARTLFSNATTSAAVLYAERQSNVPVPFDYYDEEFAPISEFWEGLFQNPYYSVKFQDAEILEQLFSLYHFSLTLWRDSKKMEPDIARVVNEHFWDLL